MGNSPIDQGGNLLGDITSEYEQLKVEARGHVLLHKENHNTYLLKEYTFCSEILFRNKEKELKSQIDQGTARQYIVNPVKVETRVFNSFCSTSYKIYAIFEYPQVTLKEEISARQKENKNFEEGELWSILQSCTNALSELSPLVSLNPNQIFINPDGHLKIIHYDLVDENYRVVLNDQFYYAPEKMKNFNKLDSELSLRKESIFSMGMTLLEASQLADVSSCYNYSNCSLSETIMMDMLELLSEKYSPDFVQILGNILEPNPNRRASLMQVQKVLDHYWSLEDNQEGEIGHEYEDSKGITQMAERGNESELNQLPLGQKSMNRQIVKQIVNQKSSARKSLMKQNAVAIPEKFPKYKLEQPSVIAPEEMVPITPKNLPTVNESCLYTDPKLLEMIRKDLEDINKLKHSAFYQTSKYTFMYPKTETILNSIKNFETEPKLTTASVQQFETHHSGTTQQEKPRESILKRNNELQPSKMMMKKKRNQNQLVFTVETYEDGRRYEGTTLNGKKHGNGKLIFEDGAYYDGEFQEDKMNGKGVLYYSQNYPAYNGEWCNDQFHGYGVLYNENPQQLDCEYDFNDMCEVQDFWLRYEGQFSFDNKQGYGKLFLTNGEVFEGFFAEDCLNGKGKYSCLNGYVVEGEWDQNILVSVIKQQ